jgi:FlaA1/EpsC-like NDP-sugar epimerase
MRQQVQGSSMAAHVAARLAGLRADVGFLLVDAALGLVAYGLVFGTTVQVSDGEGGQLALVVGIAVAGHLLANAVLGLYGRMWRHASIVEARHLAAAGAIVVTLLVALRLVGATDAPFELDLLGPAMATFLLGTTRFRARLFAWKRSEAGEPGQPVIVIGSRDAGACLIRDLQRTPSSTHRPVAVLDEDPRSHGLVLHGVPVVGGLDRLGAASARFGAETALLAVSSPPSSLVRAAAEAADEAGIVLRILPGLGERVRGVPALRQIRDVRIEDLLGRQEVKTDRGAVRDLVHGRRVLVTGGGGSIGSELVRQLAGFEPTQLVIVDHDETHLFDSANRIRAHLGDRCVEELLDIRDRVDVLQAFARLQPEIVFHAAAHKHVPMLERHPIEAARTNVLGTENVVDAAVAAGVERFVFISSDKAVRPRNVLGISKWLGEQLVAERAGEGRRYSCVRFGNVLGSRGSVVPTFQRQIAEGGPITVTSPDMTRYFMSVEEAVQLVLQAAVLTEHSDLFLLEMGQPVSIAAMARTMIELAGFQPHEVEVAFTGVRPGEKLVEELSTPTETVLRTAHDSVRRLVPNLVPRVALEDGLHLLRRAVAQRDASAARGVMFDLYTSAGPESVDDIALDLTHREVLDLDGQVQWTS